MRVKFKCEYNGKNFYGFQRLNGKESRRSVQSVLEQVFSRYLGQEITINGSGRTDTGVHAREQVCSFEINHNILCSTHDKLPNMQRAVNFTLERDFGGDVVVFDLEIAEDDFHARFSAKQKTYLYRVYVSRIKSPLREDFYHQIYEMPDLEKMRLFARENFKERVEIEHRQDEIWFWVTGKAFQKRQVRMMIGELLTGKPQAMPAKGLTLWSVKY